MEINKNLKYLLLIALLICMYTLSSCQKDETIAAYNKPVVEGYLIPGNVLKVKVYYQKYLDDTISYGFPITALQLQVSDGATNVSLTESEAGTYTYDDVNFIKEGKSYSLKFTYLNEMITAETIIPSKPVNFKASATTQQVPVFSPGSTPDAFVPVTFSWNNAELGYYLIGFQASDPYPTNISRNTQLKTEILLNQVSFYSTQQMTFNYTGNYRVLLFHLNKAYSDALKSSGANSLNLTNPITNVVNGLGIFTGLNADTLMLKVEQ